jgi:hypothetical protein
MIVFLAKFPNYPDRLNQNVGNFRYVGRHERPTAKGD